MMEVSMACDWESVVQCGQKVRSSFRKRKMKIYGHGIGIYMYIPVLKQDPDQKSVFLYKEQSKGMILNIHKSLAINAMYGEEIN